MALAFQSGESVKQALFEELQNILSADKNIRTSAEGRIKHLEFTEGMYLFYLLSHALGSCINSATNGDNNVSIVSVHLL